MANEISIKNLPYNLSTNPIEQLRGLAKKIGFNFGLLSGGGKIEVDAICAVILYRHLSQSQRIDAMKAIRSVSNRALMSKLITGALDTTFVNAQYGMWSLTDKELPFDKNFHEFLDTFTSYVGIGASRLGVKDLYKESKLKGKLGRVSLAIIVIWGGGGFQQSRT